MESGNLNKPIVVDGYVRLSRDDNKRNYSSIENQKLIIQRYAQENNMQIRTIYEDDGISGYSFNRPQFQKLMSNLNDINIIIAKDLSRIGRHNAKVLLFLEEMEEQGKRVILIDDNYDSFFTDDDIIGIKTWDNERHVKNTSRKVKRIKRMEQENGSLICLPAFGYVRHTINRRLVEIEEESAAIVRLIFDLYLNGYGLRKLGEELTIRGVPTASMLQKKKNEEVGIPFRRTLATKWSFAMVKEIITNDYYIGIKRTHKRERKKINGTDKKIKKENQFSFPNHHEAIIDEHTFNLAQEILEKRKTSNYRGQKKYVNLFSGVLYCKDCGLRLTAINSPRRDKYYICNSYNKKGKQFCSHAHTVTEKVLVEAVTKYLKLCRDSLQEVVQNFDLKKLKCDRYDAGDSRGHLEKELQSIKKELKVLITQKIQEITRNPSMQEVINETYDSLQNQKMERIVGIEETLKDLMNDPKIPTTAIRPCLHTALDILDEVIQQKKLTVKDIEVLINKIIVDKDGSFDIYLKHGLGELAAYDITEDRKNQKLQMMVSTIELLEQNKTGYTSVRFLAETLKAMQYPMHKIKFVPYMEHLLELGIVERTEMYHKPYKIVATKQKLLDVKKTLIMLGQTGGMPEMVFEYVLKKNNIDPRTEVTIDQGIDFGSTAAAFSGGQGDFTVEFEPHATLLEQKGDGYVVESIGESSGYVPYTAFCTKTSYITNNKEVVQGFTNALQKGMEFVGSHTAEEIANIIQPQFKEIDLPTLTTIVERYRSQDTWKGDLVFSEDGFELLQDILLDAGVIKEKVKYENLVNTNFAENAAKK